MAVLESAFVPESASRNQPNWGWLRHKVHEHSVAYEESGHPPNFRIRSRKIHFDVGLPDSAREAAR